MVHPSVLTPLPHLPPKKGASAQLVTGGAAVGNWTGVQGISVQGASLTRTLASNGWTDAGALSVGSFGDPTLTAAAAAVGVSFRPATVTKNLIVGLSSNADPSPLYTRINYGMYLNSFQQILVAELGQFYDTKTKFGCAS